MEEGIRAHELKSEGLHIFPSCGEVGEIHGLVGYMS